MKNLILFLITLTITLATTSCSEDDFGLDIEVIAPTEMTAEAGQTVDIILTLTDDTAISQLVIEGQDAGIDVLENYTTSPSSSLRWEGTATIPANASSGDTIEILVIISDTDGNRLEETIVITVG